MAFDPALQAVTLMGEMTMEHPARSIVALIGLLVILLTLSGCTFWVKTSDGRVARATVPDRTVQRFFDRVDALSLRLLRESQQLGHYGLRQIATELREEHVRLIRLMGAETSSRPISLTGLRNKMAAFELQMERRLTSPRQRRRYRALAEILQQLQGEIRRFHRSLERAVP